MTTTELKEVKEFAHRIRMETVKQLGVRGFGHMGGSLSIIDALAVLYSGAMNVDPKRPDMPERDKLVMSKGHAGPAVYATLALKGFFPLDWLATLNRPGTRLPSHCDRRLTPGIDMTTGSLGQGGSVAIGLALAKKLNKEPGYIFVVTGDGELNEGQMWEAAMFAPQHKLDNLIWLVDYNKKQLDGTTQEVMDLGDVAAKFKEFGWHAQSVDGNDVQAVSDAIAGAKKTTGKPSCIVLNTVKGAGVPCVACVELNHHMVVDEELAAKAVAELEGALK